MTILLISFGAGVTPAGGAGVCDCAITVGMLLIGATAPILLMMRIDRARSLRAEPLRALRWAIGLARQYLDRAARRGKVAAKPTGGAYRDDRRNTGQWHPHHL